jgi:hypothetical protein
MKLDSKFFSWQYLLEKINFIPDHGVFLMLTKFSFLMANIKL